MIKDPLLSCYISADINELKNTIRIFLTSLLECAGADRQAGVSADLSVSPEIFFSPFDAEQRQQNRGSSARMLQTQPVKWISGSPPPPPTPVTWINFRTAVGSVIINVLNPDGLSGGEMAPPVGPL